MSTKIFYAASPQWAALIGLGDELTKGPGFRVVKNEARTLAGFVATGAGPEVFLKRCWVGGGAAGLWQRVRGSRARRSLRGAAMLAAHGFNRPEPLAAMDASAGGAIRASYLLSEALCNAKVLQAIFGRRARAAEPDPRDRARTLLAVAREVSRLHDAGLYASDLQGTNLMVEKEAEGPKISFVDLDGFRYVGWVPWHWRLRRRNLIQLDRSAGRFLTRTERLRFLYAYLGKRPSRSQSRGLVAEMIRSGARADERYARRRARREARERRGAAHRGQEAT